MWVRLENNQKYYPQEELDDWIEWHISRGMFVHLCVRGRVVAFAFFWRVRDGQDPIRDEIYDDPEGTRAYIHYAWIAPKKRRRGLINELVARGSRKHPWAKSVAYTRLRPSYRRALKTEVIEEKDIQPENLVYREIEVGV